jgi:hypothetical protein
LTPLYLRALARLFYRAHKTHTKQNKGKKEQMKEMTHFCHLALPFFLACVGKKKKQKKNVGSPPPSQ